MVLVRKFLSQVFPGRIVPLDEPDFLFPPTAFDFFLSGDGCANVREKLEVDQAEDSVPGCESGDEPLAMFDHARLEVACHARVEVAGTAGEDVDTVGVVHVESPEADFEG